MNYFTINPPKSLAGHVRYFWVLEGEASVEQEYVHRSMADGCAELIFHYQGVFDELISDNTKEKSFSSGLSGPSQRFRRFSIQQNFGIFGAYLYPFAASQFFSLPEKEIQNQMLNLKTVAGTDADELEKKVMLPNNHSERVRIVSASLEQK